MTDACASAGFSPNFVIESNDYPTAEGFVAAGLGVTIAPRMGLGAHHPGVAVRRLQHPEPSRGIQAAFREACTFSPATGSFIDALHAAAAAND